MGNPQPYHRRLIQRLLWRCGASSDVAGATVTKGQGVTGRGPRYKAHAPFKATRSCASPTFSLPVLDQRHATCKLQCVAARAGHGQTTSPSLIQLISCEIIPETQTVLFSDNPNSMASMLSTSVSHQFHSFPCQPQLIGSTSKTKHSSSNPARIK